MNLIALLIVLVFAGIFAAVLEEPKLLAHKLLGDVVVANGRIAAEQAGRPVGIPVVVDRATDTPSLRQLELAIAAVGSRKVDGIGGHTEANALVSAGNAGTAEHREARRSR